MPESATVLAWIADDAEFRKAYERALESSAEYALGEIREIERRMLTGHIAPAAGRAVIASMQWRMERVAPKRFAPTADAAERARLGLEELVRASIAVRANERPPMRTIASAPALVIVPAVPYPTDTPAPATPA